MRTIRIAGVGAIALTLALATAGCGSSRSGEAATGGTGATGSSSSVSSTTDAASSTKFGTMASPCGKGDAKGSTDQGVTASSITIGYGDDRGYAPAPGLNQEVGDAVDAMIKWCNAQGGINGRKLVGHRYDAAVTNAVPVMKKACAQDFMLVGDGFAGDVSSDPVRVACKLPHIPSFTVGPNATMGKLHYEPMPYPVDEYNAAGVKAELATIPELKSMTLIGVDQAAMAVSNLRYGTAITKLGTTPKSCGIVLHAQGDASYAPMAQKLKSCGVTAFFTSYTPSPQIFGFLQALQQAGVKVAKVAESQWYSKAAAQWNAQSHAGDGITVPLFVQPLENADTVPAVADYQKIVTGNGGKTSMTGEFAASAFLLWAEAAKACGSDLTRDCVMSKVSSVHDWTAGGLQAPSDPGANKPSDCALLMQLEGGTWKQVYPTTKGQFSCDKSNVLPFDPAQSGVKLNADRTFASFVKQ